MRNEPPLWVEILAEFIVLAIVVALIRGCQ